MAKNNQPALALQKSKFLISSPPRRGERAVCFGVGIEKEDFEGPGFAGLDGAGVGGDGGIVGDFPICVVPMLEQDVRREGVRKWAYFCQISDSTTSYGSYSGAVPNE